MAFGVGSFLNVLKRVIDGISSNLANTFLSSRQILLIKNKGLGPILLELFPFVIFDCFCTDSFLDTLKSH